MTRWAARAKRFVRTRDTIAIRIEASEGSRHGCGGEADGVCDAGVRAEVALVATCFNMARVMTLFEVGTLLPRLRMIG